MLCIRAPSTLNSLADRIRTDWRGDSLRGVDGVVYAPMESSLINLTLMLSASSSCRRT